MRSIGGLMLLLAGLILTAGSIPAWSLSPGWALVIAVFVAAPWSVVGFWMLRNEPSAESVVAGVFSVILGGVVLVYAWVMLEAPYVDFLGVPESAMPGALKATYRISWPAVLFAILAVVVAVIEAIRERSRPARGPSFAVGGLAVLALAAGLATLRCIVV
jgi:hypothetical protein